MKKHQKEQWIIFLKCQENFKMKRKTYNNVIKASRLIMKKGYNKQESLDMAVKIFDMMEEMKNSGYEILSAETYIAMKANKEEWQKNIK